MHPWQKYGGSQYSWLPHMEFRSRTRNPFPGFERVYHAHDPGTPEFRARINDFSIEDAFDVLRGEKAPSTPVSARWVMGRRLPRDFVWTTLAVPFIASDRVIDLLRRHTFTGWSTFPVELLSDAGEHISGYHGLAVHGRCGPRQKERSALIAKPGPVGNTIQVHQGLFFDEDAWDGSDVFMPDDGSGLVFVVQEVRDALTAAKVKGISLDRVDLHERLFP
jgi:hypothetical protein